MKKYTVKEVAKLSGTSVRTLHFYDEIDLLKPAFVGDNGYRYYEREQLLSLQQILFYRELGFSLAQIRTVMKQPDFDKLSALRRHRQALADDAEKLRVLLQTLDRTIADLEGGAVMKGKDLFRGFSAEKQKAYENELVERYGENARTEIDESKRRTRGWTREDYQRAKTEGDQIFQALVDSLSRRALPESAEVQALIERHYQWICLWWTPPRDSYRGLGELYVNHPDFRKFFDAFDPRLVDFLAQAMGTFAETRL